MVEAEVGDERDLDREMLVPADGYFRPGIRVPAHRVCSGIVAERVAGCTVLYSGHDQRVWLRGSTAAAAIRLASHGGVARSLPRGTDVDLVLAQGDPELDDPEQDHEQEDHDDGEFHRHRSLLSGDPLPDHFLPVFLPALGFRARRRSTLSALTNRIAPDGEGQQDRSCPTRV